MGCGDLGGANVLGSSLLDHVGRLVSRCNTKASELEFCCRSRNAGTYDGLGRLREGRVGGSLGVNLSFGAFVGVEAGGLESPYARLLALCAIDLQHNSVTFVGVQG